MNWQEWQLYADDERNWIDNNERGILKVEPLHDFILRLWFEEESYCGCDEGQRFNLAQNAAPHTEQSINVTIYDLDFHDLFVEQNPGGVFAPLGDPEQFRLVQGDYALIWPDPESGRYDENSVDLAPECVRFFCERYGRKVKTANSGSASVLVMA